MITDILALRSAGLAELPTAGARRDRAQPDGRRPQPVRGRTRASHGRPHGVVPDALLRRPRQSPRAPRHRLPHVRGGAAAQRDHLDSRRPGAVLPEVRDILSVIAAEDAVLTCGHLGVEESPGADRRRARGRACGASWSTIPLRRRRLGRAGGGVGAAGRHHRALHRHVLRPREAPARPGRAADLHQGGRRRADHPVVGLGPEEQPAAGDARSAGPPAGCSTPASPRTDIRRLVGTNAGQLLLS